MTSDRSATQIVMYPDGPLVVRGDFEVRDVDGTALSDAPVIALCRCGRSARKPLCDGSHRLGLRRRQRVE